VLTLAGGFPAERLGMVRGATRGLDRAPADLVLDLAGAGFLSATVLGELTALVARVRSVGGRTAIVASAAARRQLEAAGLGRLAPFAPSVTDAIGRLSRGDGGRPVGVAA
jgi:anti-anti-sigma regulatory factor